MKSKYKITKKKGRRLLIINSEKGQTLNKREVEEIQNGTICGVLPLDVEIKKKGFVLTYDLTNYISLEQYIHTLVNKEKFIEIMLQILEIFQNLTEQFCSTQNLAMDLDKVMVVPATNQIYFPFIPILYYDYGVTVKDFLIGLIYETTFDSTQDTRYADGCLSILQKNMNFSRVELEEYLKSQSDDGRTWRKRNTASEIQEIYNPMEQWNRKEHSYMPELREKKVIPQKEHEISKSSRMTESLTDTGEGGTILLGETEASYLKQVRTGKVFPLKQSESRIGKRQCTIEITDNPAVSRVHARIVKMNENYFLEDLKATNGTKVNGKRVTAGEQIMLADEDMLEFADEKFIFYK